MITIHGDRKVDISDSASRYRKYEDEEDVREAVWNRLAMFVVLAVVLLAVVLRWTLPGATAPGQPVWEHTQEQQLR